MPRPLSPLLAALALGACAPAVLATPRVHGTGKRMALMESFEAWYEGFRARLSQPSSEAARDGAAEAVFVLRNPALWDLPEMAPSVVPRERLIQLARWQALRAVEARPEDGRALEALADLDLLAGDRTGNASCRCRLADLADQSFDARLRCAEALAAAGGLPAAQNAWRRAFALADADGERFQVFQELEQAVRGGDALAGFPSDAIGRYRAAAGRRPVVSGAPDAP